MWTVCTFSIPCKNTDNNNNNVKYRLSNAMVNDTEI